MKITERQVFLFSEKEDVQKMKREEEERCEVNRSFLFFSCVGDRSQCFSQEDRGEVPGRRNAFLPSFSCG